MGEIASALARAARDLVAPRMLAIVLLPMLASVALWIALAWAFWDAWTGGVERALASTAAAGWLRTWGAAWVIDSAAAVLVVMAILPAVFVTAIVITEIFAMPVIVRFVSARHYAMLGREEGGTVAGSVLNAMTGIAVFALLWIVTLPLWLTGAGAVLAPVLTSAYLAQRIFRYDALAEHASAAEYARIVRAARGRLYLLGVLLAPLLYLPVVNLLMPVYAGLAYTHFCLARLARERALG
jgi:uncharacterized protein involved in cysteine biosynthesis